MGNVLTEATTLKCGPTTLATPHGGTVSATVTTRLKVRGNKVLVVDGSRSWPIAAKTCGDTGSNQTPCTAVNLITGTASKLTVDGKSVALDAISGTTNGLPPGTIAAPALPVPALLRAV
jgi:hypothetical protein